MRSIVAAVLGFLVLATGSSRSQTGWRTVGELTKGRCMVGTVYLGSGRILVMGGSTGIPELNDPRAIPQSTCEIVDVWLDRIEQAAPMTLQRSEFVALRTVDSNVVVIGGVTGIDRNGDVTGSVELFDRTSGSWRVLGSLKTARRQHVAGFIDANRILVVGGRRKDYGSLTDAEIFDLRTGTSTPAASFPFAINDARLVPSVFGELAVVGGRTGGTNSDRRSEVYVYDAAHDRWDLTSALAQAVSAVSALRLWDQRMLVVGGIMRDDPLQAQDAVQLSMIGGWKSMVRMAQPLAGARLAQCSESRILAIGGVHNDRKPVATTEWINISRGTRSDGPTLTQGRDRFAALAIPAGPYAQPDELVVVVVGGLKDVATFATAVEVLGPADQKTSGVAEARSDLPFSLSAFPGEVRLDLSLDHRVNVTVRIVAVDGRIALEPVRGTRFEAGEHRITIDTGELPRGWFMLELVAGDIVYRQRLVVTR